VIVHENDRLGRVLNRGTEDLARVYQAAVKGTHAYQVRADDLKLRVQGDNVKFLLGRVIGPSGKLVAAEPKSVDGVGDAGNAVLVLGKTRGDAPAQLNAGNDLAICGLADGCRNVL
jgi:hypothetical protein